jgi:membrane protein implicated in regulation of membrane protease activity
MVRLPRQRLSIFLPQISSGTSLLRYSMTTLIWITAGFILVLLELFAPGFILVFVGLSALITGVGIWLGMPSTGAVPWLVFSILTILQIVLLRRYCQKWFRGETVSGKDHAGLDVDFVGKPADVLSGFQQADSEGKRFSGRVSYRGSQWDAICKESLQSGQRVTIVGRDGMILIVRPA